jgi:hypothetical protein
MPIGETYNQVLLQLTDIALSDIEEIRVVGNGEPMMRYITANGKSAGEWLNIINQFEGRSASADGLLIIDFERYGLRTREQQETSAIGTGYAPSRTGYKEMGGLGIELSTLSLELDLKSTIAGSPAISGKAVQSPSRPLGKFKRILPFLFTANAVGANEISELARVNSNAISKLFALTPNVNNLKIETNQVIQFDRSKTENKLLQNDGVRAHQATMFVYDPSEAGNGREILQTAGVTDLRLTYDMSATGSLPVVVEYVGVLGN